MNNCCTYLNIPYALFKEGFDPSQLPKTAHFKLNQKDYLSDEIQNWFSSLNLNILLVEVFYTAPNRTGIIHTDSVGGDYTKLNWQFGGANSSMHWYSITTKEIKRTAINKIGGRYLAGFSPNEVTEIHSQPIQNPSLVQVGIPHNIKNYNEDRWTVCIVFKTRSFPFYRPTWNESLTIFKDYLAPLEGIEPPLPVS